MKRLLREPMLHFGVIGGIVFAVYAGLRRDSVDVPAEESREVRIGESELAWLRETWGRQWQREPTPQEMRGLVTEFLKEELMSREARALGLDEGDTIVRRRLAQKLAFILEDTSVAVEPTDEELQQIYAAHPERYATDPQITFEQVFLNPERHADAAADAAALLEKLNAPESAEPADTLGDRTMLDFAFVDTDKRGVDAQLGGEFTEAVVALQEGPWQGPIVSGYGLHLVRVIEITPGRARALEEVREIVRDDWRAERKKQDAARYFDTLLKKYSVKIDENIKPLVGPLDSFPDVPAANESDAR